MGKGGAFAGFFATPVDVGVGGPTARLEDTSKFFDSYVQFEFIEATNNVLNVRVLNTWCLITIQHD